MEFKGVYETFLRSISVIAILFILVKIMGKKQVSQLNLFDYIIGISIGSLAADISLDLEKNFPAGIMAISVYAFIAVLISYLTLKSIKLRRLFTGTPSVLMENGKIIEEGLRKVKYDVNDLLEEARSSGYFNLDEIEYAIMEASGRVSFLPKDENKPLTKKDMKIKPTKDYLTANLVIDEKPMINNIECLGKDEKWLKHELKVQGYKSYKGILLATLDSSNKLKVYKKDTKSKYDTVLE